MPVNLGGLGLIRLDELLKAQQVTWFKRAHASCPDNWQVNLKNLCHGNCLLANYEEIPNNRHPILKGIATSFCSFTYEYNLINSNLLESFLINNPVVKRGERDNRLLTLNFFQDNIPRLAHHHLVNLKVKDIADGNLFLKRLDDIEIPFSILTYMRLLFMFCETK